MLRRPERGVGRRWAYWTQPELEELVALARSGKSTPAIAKIMARTPKSIRNKASQMGLPLGRARRAIQRSGDTRLRRIVVTADFDVSTLTVEERRALAARLLEGLPPAVVVIPQAYDARAAGRARFEAKWGPRPDREARRSMKLAAKDAPSRRAKRREKRTKKLDEWYQRQLAPGSKRVKKLIPLAPLLDEREIDFGRDDQEQVIEDGPA